MIATSVFVARTVVVAFLVALLVVLSGASTTPADAATTDTSLTKPGKPAKKSSAPKKRANAAPTTSADPRDAQQRQSAERDRLTARIAEIKAQIAAGERSRSGATVALAHAERALATVNRRLDDLARKQRDALEQAAAIDRQRNATEGQIAARQRAWAVSTQLFDRTTRQDPLHALLTGADPGETVRLEGDLGYFAAAQTRDLVGLKTRVDDLQAQRRHADETRSALATQAEAEMTTRQSLAADQATQRQTLAQLSKQIAQQRDTATALEADETRLGRIVQQLQKIIERQAAEDKARREAAAKRSADLAGTRKSPARSPKEAPPPVDEPLAVEPADASVASGAFVQLQGRLRLPVRGTVTGRFGGPRGAGGGTWKGVFVHTDSGAEVHAVAAGRVVFADDLRGFGNLLIIDHGDQYLSIYGNNDTLTKKAGDAVKPGDVVAHAGNSIGDDQTGLYFELRFRGRPFDPLSWTAGR